MTYNVVRKVSRSSSIANPPFPRSDLSMDSPWPLPLLLQLHPFNMHQASKDLGDADKETRSRAAPAAPREVARRYYESHREGIDEAIREGGGASQPPRLEKLSDVLPLVAGTVGGREAEQPLGRELA